MTIEYTFFGIIFGCFTSYLFQYIIHGREVYTLWVQEIVYGEDSLNENEEPKLTNKELEITKEKTELFSKIESLTRDLITLSDILLCIFMILCFAFFVSSVGSIYSLEIFKSGSFHNLDQIQLIVSIILYTILFCLLPQILKSSARIDIIRPYKTNKLDEKLFDVWYKYRCFEYKNSYFKNRLEPRILYEILARKYKNKETTFDGKNIEIPEYIKKVMEKQGLFK